MRHKWGVGIVGCGMISSFQARAIQELPNAELRGFCSRTESKARAAGEKFGTEWATRIEPFLAWEGLDVVSICTPSGAHAELAVAAARAGKHVMVEKPLEITLPRCDSIIEACRRAGVKLGVIFPSRFHDGSRLIQKALNGGRFGRLSLGDAYVKWWRSQEYYDQGGWKGTKRLDGGGALMNQSIHAIDLLQWFMGPVDSISGSVATLAHRGIEVEDTAVATLRYRNGALGVIEGATSVHPGFLKKLEISGDRGSVILQEENLLAWQFAEERPEDASIRETFGSRTKTGGGASDPAAIGHEGHWRQFADFLEAIESGREPLVNGEEGRKSVEIILAVYQSSETGRPVKLPM
ncbi:MAG: Gfo/Idh/MocA family oxidoreductase [Planctomycetes bacterium]|nr:Gfo/Idh/MocA family oxidoreductase [Planctomycetota bacterium]